MTIPAQSQIPEAAVSWLTSQIGAFETLGAYRTGSLRTGVWRVQSAKSRFFFKINRRRNRWATEVFAYRHWAGAFGCYVAKLEGVFENETCPGLLLAEVPGRPLRETTVSGGAVTSAYRRAGQLLRRLHDSAVGEWFGCVDEAGRPMDWDGNPLPDGLSHDLARQKHDVLQSLMEKGGVLDCLEQRESEVLQWAIDSVECYASEAPVPTSEDYTPGNWLVDANGQLAAIIDLENTCWGDRIMPFTRLLMDYFPACPEGEKAFYEGYGCPLPAEQPAQSRVACAIYAAYYTVLGAESGNEGHLRRGRAAFRRIAF